MLCRSTERLDEKVPASVDDVTPSVFLGTMPGGKVCWDIHVAVAPESKRHSNGSFDVAPCMLLMSAVENGTSSGWLDVGIAASQ